MVETLRKLAVRASIRFSLSSFQWTFGIVLCGSCILVSCGGGGKSPTPVTLQSISVSAASAKIVAGLKQQLSATGNYSDGTSKAVTSVMWSTSDATVATVDSTGLVTAVKQGSVTISATS